MEVIIFWSCGQFIYNLFKFIFTKIYFSNRTKKNESNDVIISKQDLIYNIYIYTGIIVVLIVSTIIRGFTFFNVCTRASNRLHNIILVRLMRAQMSFFDCNLAGQILNRLAKDLGIIDENVAYITYDVQLVMFYFYVLII